MRAGDLAVAKMQPAWRGVNLATASWKIGS